MMLKVAFLVSSDYGELGNAMSFLKNYQSDLFPILLIPSLYPDPKTDNSKYHLYKYETIEQIIKIIDNERPCLIFLFSGYLLSLGNYFSLFSFYRLIKYFRKQDILLITSDPFLCRLTKPCKLSFADIVASNRNGINGIRGRLPLLTSALIKAELSILYRILKKEIHIYPAPIKKGSLPDGHRYLSYFNRDNILPGNNKNGDLFKSNKRGKKYWIFVLAEIDYNLQYYQVGERFIDCVADRLNDVVQMNKMAMLIGPGNLIEKLKYRGLGTDTVELFDELVYKDYLQKLMGAEYAFFWNCYSFSLLHRIINKLPVFFFDKGHMVRILPQLYDLGIQNYYQGWEPSILSIKKQLDMDKLTKLSKQFFVAAEKIISEYSKCHTPKEVISIALESRQ